MMNSLLLFILRNRGANNNHSYKRYKS